MSLPRNVIDEIQNYDPAKLKAFAELQKNNIESNTIFIEGVKSLQTKLSDLSDQVIIDSIVDRFIKTQQINYASELGIVSLSCYTPDQLYKTIKNLKEIQNATDDILERYKNRTEPENSPCNDKQPTS